MTHQTEPLHKVSATEPDERREQFGFCEWDPGKRLLRSIRDYQRLRQQTALFYPLRIVAVLRHRFWTVISGADIPLNCNVGIGLLLPHPNGVVIHSNAVLGPNCTIFHQVTLGTVATGGVPTLGGHVDVGAGAKLLGPIVVGHHVTIGANAVVLTDVPDEHVAVGIPARCRPRQDNA